MNELFSIAMATYNGEKYIKEQIDSILLQTIQNFELVICDDCSSDRTREILHEYARHDSRIKVYENEVNLGFVKNFEKAILLCKGNYIAISDQDDIWYNNHLEILYKNIGNKSLSCANALLIDEYGRSLGKKLNEVEKFYKFYPNKSIYSILLNRNNFAGCCMLLKRDFIKKIIPIPKYVLFHDVWLAASACLDDGLIYCFENITNYRQHRKSITFLNRSSNLVDKIKNIYRRIKKFFFTGIPVDRFKLIEELNYRFGKQNNDFMEISIFFEKIKNKQIDIQTIKWLYSNYKYIITNNTHRGFILRILLWYRMKDMFSVNQTKK